MKLRSVHFAGMVPVPGTDSVERNFYAVDGWEIERNEDGSVSLKSAAHDDFVADGFSYSFVEMKDASQERLEQKDDQQEHRNGDAGGKAPETSRRHRVRKGQAEAKVT